MYRINWPFRDDPPGDHTVIEEREHLMNDNITKNNACYKTLNLLGTSWDRSGRKYMESHGK